MKASICQYFASYLDDLLDRDDIPSMPQAYRLFGGQAFVALLHRLQTTTIILSSLPQNSSRNSVNNLFLPNLFEVTLFNEDCGRKWNHVASFGLVGREVWHLYF